MKTNIHKQITITISDHEIKLFDKVLDLAETFLNGDEVNKKAWGQSRQEHLEFIKQLRGNIK